MINRQPTPEPPRHWTPVQRLPESPDAVIMTSTGYSIGGHHVRTVPAIAVEPVQSPHKPFWQRLIQRSEQ